MAASKIVVPAIALGLYQCASPVERSFRKNPPPWRTFHVKRHYLRPDLARTFKSSRSVLRARTGARSSSTTRSRKKW